MGVSFWSWSWSCSHFLPLSQGEDPIVWSAQRRVGAEGAMWWNQNRSVADVGRNCSSFFFKCRNVVS